MRYDRDKKKERNGGKSVHLGYFDTAKEAATAYARSEYGRADAAKLLQPRTAPTAAGAEAIRQAEREGLTLTTSSSNSTGYKGVTFCPKRKGSKKYQGEGWRQRCEPRPLRHRRAGGALLRPQGRGQGHQRSHRAATAATAALAFLSRWRRGCPAGGEGLTLATTSSSTSGYKGVCYRPNQTGSNTHSKK